MKSPSHQSLIVGFTMALVLIGVVSWLNLDFDSRVRTSAEWVAHTHLVRYSISRLLSDVQDVEVGTRGFILTGTPVFLEPYNAAIKQVEAQIRLIRELTSTIPQQQRYLDALEPLIRHRLELAEDIVRVRKEQGFEPAQALVAGGQGRKTMDAVRAEIERMDAVEARLLKDRDVVNRREAVTVRQLTFLGAGVSFLLLGLVFALLLHENRLRLRAEVTLRQSRTDLARAQEAAHLGSWSWDIARDRVSWSDEMHRIYGVDPAGFVATVEGVSRLIHPEDLWKQERCIRELLAGQSFQPFEYRVLHPDGTLRTVDVSSMQLDVDDGGRPQRVFGIAQDITERKLVQEELLKKNAEIEHFTNAVSHDLKSPLVTIKTFLGFLEKDLKAVDAEAADRDLGYIHRAADQMERLLAELLELASIGHTRNASVQMPLQEVVQEALGLVAGQLAVRGVEVEVTRDPVWLYGDRPRLVEVFQNLIDNAVKFLGDQTAPRIEIGAERENGEIVLFVRDNGKGIDPRHQLKLFGLFEKLDPHTPGSGIGLAMVRRILLAHGGKIQAQSDGPGKGATFRFTLANTRLGAK